MFDLKNFLRDVIQSDVSDIHLRVGEVPSFRQQNEIIKTDYPPLSGEMMDNIVMEILPEYTKSNIDNIYNLDFLYELPGVARYRVNYARSAQNPMLVMRVIPYEAPDFNKRRIPEILKQVTHNNSGIICVTGPTGCGKSTTLTAMLEYVNQTFAKHIITIEDPIEFLYTNKKSIFSQRQVGLDTESFPSAVKYALRQDPDIILIGEIRDKETAREALSAAETGHLVLTTLHTSDAVQTVNRMVNLFEPYEREQIRVQLSQILKATISQKLLKTKDNKSRVPAFEILFVTSTIKDYIAKDKIDEIYSLLKEGKYTDMITLNMYLASLVKEGLVTKEEALEASENKLELSQVFKGQYH